MTRAAIYARLSRNRDGEKSATLEYQEERSREIAEAQGWKVVATLTDDDMSGTKSNRPGFQRLQQLIVNQEIDWIVFQSTDRLVRDREDSAMLSRLSRDNDVYWRQWAGEVDIRSAQGQMLHGVQASMDQFYADQISEKVQVAHQRRLEEGRPNGGGKLFGDQSEEQAAVVRKLVDMALEGTSLNEMCRWLNDRGIPTTRGNEWQATTLKNLLVNPRLAGILTYKGEEIGRIADYEPLISEEDHVKLVAILTSPSVKRNPGNPSRLLTALLVCSTCGGPMKGSSNGTRKMYTCRPENVMPDEEDEDGKPAKCRRRMSVSAAMADESIVGRLMERLDAVQELREAVERELGASVSGLMAERDAIKAKVSRNYDSFMEGIVDRADYLRTKERLEDELESVEGRIGPRALAPDVESVGREAWEAGSYQWRKALLADNIVKIIVGPSRLHASKGFDHGRLIVEWRAG